MGGRRNYLTFKRGRSNLGTVSSRLPLSVYIHVHPWNARARALCFVGVNRNGNNTRCITRYRTIRLSAGTNIARYKNTENAMETGSDTGKQIVVHVEGRKKQKGKKTTSKEHRLLLRDSSPVDSPPFDWRDLLAGIKGNIISEIN